MNELAKVDEAGAVLAAWAAPPPVALVLGSGLASVFGEDDGQRLSFRQIPHLTPPSVEGHAGRLSLRTVGSQTVACLEGRIHLYEGHSPADVVRAVRAVGAWGCQTLVLTNSAGSLRPEWPPGTAMLIADQLNFTGRSPLEGPNVEAWGPRFPDMGALYDPELRAKMRSRGWVEGVYAGVLGPEYETPAMVRHLRGAGADAVGMSTVLEATAARHMGLRVFGVSCLTNLAAGLGDEPLRHAEVTERAREAQGTMAELLETLVGELGHSVVAPTGQNG